MRNTLVRAGLGLVMAAMTGRLAFAEPSLCVVPVPVDSNPSTNSPGLQIPSTAKGMEYPLLYDRGIGPGWRLTKERNLEPIERNGGFPNSYLDKFVIEPSGRVIGYAHMSPVVHVRAPGGDRFQPLPIDGFNPDPRNRRDSVIAMAWVDHLGGTVISTGLNGVQLLKGDGVSTLPGLKAVEIGKVFSIKDFPEIRAVALVDDAGSVFLLDWTGRARNVSSRGVFERFSQRDARVRIRVDGPNRLVITRNEIDSVFALQATEEGLVSALVGRYPRPENTNGGLYYPAVGERLVYGYRSMGSKDAGPPLMRLTDAGWVPVEGGDRENLGESARFFEIRSQHSVIVRGWEGGLYRYTGQGTLIPIADSSPADIGRFPDILEVRSLGKVVVAGTGGIFELTTDNRVVPLPPPLGIDLGRVNRMAELPVSGVLIIFGTGGIFALDRAGNFAPIRGADPVRHNAHNVSVLPLAKRNEILVDAAGAFFMVLDEEVAGQGACAEAIVNETNDRR